MSNEDYKSRIRVIVTEYVRLFPSEFEDFKKGQTVARDRLRTKWGEMKSEGYIARKVLELPATLFGLLTKSLPADAFAWFKSKEGTRWFEKAFTDFAAAKKVR